MLMARSGAERLRMGLDMFDSARRLVLAGLRAEGDGDLRARLFLRTYGREFGDDERRRILRRLRDRVGSSARP
jgi:hypothetical protein